MIVVQLVVVAVVLQWLSPFRRHARLPGLRAAACGLLGLYCGVESGWDLFIRGHWWAGFWGGCGCVVLFVWAHRNIAAYELRHQ